MAPRLELPPQLRNRRVLLAGGAAAGVGALALYRRRRSSAAAAPAPSSVQSLGGAPGVTYNSIASDVYNALIPQVETLARQIEGLQAAPPLGPRIDELGAELDTLGSLVDQLRTSPTPAPPPTQPPAAPSVTLPTLNPSAYPQSFAFFDPGVPGGGWVDLGILGGADQRNVSGGAPVYAVTDTAFGPIAQQGAAVRPGVRLYTPRAFSAYVVG